MKEPSSIPLTQVSTRASSCPAPVAELPLRVSAERSRRSGAPGGSLRAPAVALAHCQVEKGSGNIPLLDAACSLRK